MFVADSDRVFIGVCALRVATCDCRNVLSVRYFHVLSNRLHDSMIAVLQRNLLCHHRQNATMSNKKPSYRWNNWLSVIFKVTQGRQFLFYLKRRTSFPISVAYNKNLVPISHRFRDMASFPLNFLPPLYLTPPI